MKKNKNRFKKFISFLLTAQLLFAAIASVLTSSVAFATEKNWYVCFENQNYAVRNANLMSYDKEREEYILSNVYLDDSIGFYVTDGEGTIYCTGSGGDIYVDSSDLLRYNILFHPDNAYANTGCKVSYELYSPGDVYLLITDAEGTETVVQMTYNAYNSAYDLYYISSVSITEGSTVRYYEPDDDAAEEEPEEDFEEISEEDPEDDAEEEDPSETTAEYETHVISASGYYRILYTAGRTIGGNTYLFDENGNYGSGDGYEYNIYIEDAPKYFAVFERLPSNIEESSYTVNGKTAYLLERDESEVSAAKYSSCDFFTAAPDTDYTVYIYEEGATGGLTLVTDDDGDEINIADGGWNKLVFYPTDGNYTIATEEITDHLNGWYVAGNFNGWGYDEYGNRSLSDDFLMTEVEEDDDYYEADYAQYTLLITVTAADLREGDVEFYITDGTDKYMNRGKYITFTDEGTYRILFSEEHIYGNERNYRYFLVEIDIETAEIYIGSVAEWNNFAKECTASADYSVNKEVYLTADIDFKGVEFIPAVYFNGTFYGGYHTLSNITVSDTAAVYGVFGTLSESATVERIYVENLTINCKECDYVGFVCKNYGTVKYVTVSGSVTGNGYVGGIVAYNGRTPQNGVSGGYAGAVIEGCINNAEVYGAFNCGGVCGYNYGDIISCTNNGAVTGKTSSPDTAAVAVGGIAGYSAATVETSANNGSVSGAYNVFYTGGIAGICTGEMYFCFNYGSVSGTQYVGGAAGYYGTVDENSDDLYSYFAGMDYESFYNEFFGDDTDDEEEEYPHILSYIYNAGNVTAKSYAGGVLGYTVSNVFIYNSVSIGDVSVTAGNFSGGIVGFTDSAAVSGCLTSGNIGANGSAGGNYVGGICGYGYSVMYSMSSAYLKGNDYIGGICGYQTGTTESNYTNVLIVCGKNCYNVGAIIGYSATFSATNNSFDDTVRYNYYVGDIGGVGGTDYGQTYDYAAVSIESEYLACEDIISPYLSGFFNAEYWKGGEGAATYPVHYYLLNVQIPENYSNESRFEKMFDEYGSVFSSAAEHYTRISYTVVFMEWNEDEGELYDDDGVWQQGNYVAIYTVRLFEGESLSDIPDFQYAQRLSDGVWVYYADDAIYFVSFEDTNYSCISSNMTVYALYTAATTTLATDDGTVLVEGLFDANTEVTAVETENGVRLYFRLYGEEVSVGTVRVKYYIGENAKDYAVYYYGTAGEIAADEYTVSGRYLSFSYTDGQLFFVREDGFTMPYWGWILCGAGGAAVVFCVLWGVAAVIRKKRAKKFRQKKQKSDS